LAAANRTVEVERLKPKTVLSEQVNSPFHVLLREKQIILKSQAVQSRFEKENELLREQIRLLQAQMFGKKCEKGASDSGAVQIPLFDMPHRIKCLRCTGGDPGHLIPHTGQLHLDIFCNDRIIFDNEYLCFIHELLLLTELWEMI